MLHTSVYIYKCFKKAIRGIIVKESFVIINIKIEYLKEFLLFLKVNTRLQMQQLLDLWGIDFPDEPDRFKVSYLVSSVRLNVRIILRVSCKDNQGLRSVTDLYKSAGWLEREVWDMYGIFFEQNNDLRRILTDYGFEGFPLRKDFPLMGYVEVRFDEGLKRVVVEPIEMTQEFRAFEFISPWERVNEF
jgi:NADH-quinone oxidoreductase subunit C